MQFVSMMLHGSRVRKRILRMRRKNDFDFFSSFYFIIYPLANSKNCCSLIISIPNCLAFMFLELPEFGLFVTKKDKFFVTLDLNAPPNEITRFFASFLVILLSFPVMQIDFPLKIPPSCLVLMVIFLELRNKTNKMIKKK